MRPQREKHSATEVAGLMGKTLADGHFSGGQIENFRSGWAKYIRSPGGRVHYFERRGFDGAEALCGAVYAEVRWLYGPGNIPHCEHCVHKRAAPRRIAETGV